MEKVRASYAWLGVRWDLMKDSDWKDRGEGPVSYIAIILLIALIALAIVGSGVDKTIATGISDAVKKVISNGNS